MSKYALDCLPYNMDMVFAGRKFLLTRILQCAKVQTI